MVCHTRCRCKIVCSVQASFEDRLRLWELQTSQMHSALAFLLVYIRQHQPHCKLPLDSRTFTHTPVLKSPEAEITSIGGGRLWYRGVATCLQRYCRNVKPSIKGFEIDFFVDGMPLYKSSQWSYSVANPILAIIRTTPVINSHTVQRIKKGLTNCSVMKSTRIISSALLHNLI